MRASLAALVALSASVFAYAAEQPTVAVKADGVDRKLPRRALADALAATGLDVELDASSSSTNAQRLARGLAPSPPKRLFSPTEDRLAARASNSPSGPTYPQSGYIYAKNDQNQLVGYLTNAVNPDGTLGTFSNVDSSAIMQVTVDAPIGQSAFSNIEVTNAPFIGPSITRGFLGAIQGAGTANENIDPANGDYVLLGFTQQTAAGAGPTSDMFGTGNSYNAATQSQQKYESNVFSVDLNTGLISMFWTKTDLTTEGLATGEVTVPPTPDLNPSLVGAPSPSNFVGSKNANFLPYTLYFTVDPPAA